MAVIATGFFDGVHLGHREVINNLVSSARQRGEEAIVITFAQHPRAVLQQDARTLRFLCSTDEKVRLLKEAGVDRVEILEFSRNFAAMSARDYLSEVVIGRFAATCLVLGYDNRLGSDKQTPDQIVPMARELGLEVVVVPAGSAESGVVVSSTKIREALSRGDVEAAAAMLGYDYSVCGPVVSGKQLGRTIGFPTANMMLYEPLKLIPAKGVYLTEVEVLGGRYYGMTNVGDIIETHIFDFSEDIYGLDLKVIFKKRLRDGKRFSSVDELKSQLIIDEESCRVLF